MFVCPNIGGRPSKETARPTTVRAAHHRASDFDSTYLPFSPCLYERPTPRANVAETGVRGVFVVSEMPATVFPNTTDYVHVFSSGVHTGRSYERFAWLWPHFTPCVSTYLGIDYTHIRQRAAFVTHIASLISTSLSCI